MTKAEIDQNHSWKVTRYALLIAVGWTLLIGTLVIMDWRHELADARTLAENEARIHFLKDRAFRLWVTNHGGVYVPITEHTPPNPYLSQMSDRDIITTEGKKLTLINPAYMIRQVMEEFEKEYGVKGHITSLRPLRPENKPDDWERLALESFELGESEVMEFTEINSVPYLRLMRPLLIEEQCLKCHEDQGYKVGSIRGGTGVSVSVPAQPFFTLAQEEGEEHSRVMGAFWLLGLLALTLSGRTIRRNFRHRNLAKEALRKSEGKFLKYTSNAPGSVFVIDAQGRFLEVNQAACGLTGYTQSELTTISIHDILEPGTNSLVIENLEQLIKTGVSKTEFRLKRKNGSVIWSSLDAVALSENTYMAFCSDITERKEAEQKTRHLAQIVEESLNEIYVFDADTLKFVQVNHGARENIGYTSEELAESTPLDIKPELTRKSLVELLEPLKSGAKEIVVFETVHKRKNGTCYDIEINLQMSEWDGRPVFVAFVLDITKRKQVEEANARLSRAIEQADETIVITDSEGTIQYVNPAFEKTTGYTVEEAIGQNPRILKSGKHDDTYYKEMWTTLTNGKEWRGEIVNKKKDGTLYIENVIISPVFDSQGKIVNYVAAKSDITERKKAEEKVEQLAAFAKNNPAPVLRTDLEGTITLVNPAASFLFDRDITGESIESILPSGVVAFSKLTTDGKPSHFEQELGDRLYLFSIFKDESTSSAYIYGTNITETRRLQDLESRAQRLEMAGTIAGQVAHDFNNLLAPIMAYPGMIHEELPAGHSAHEYLDDIETAARSIAEINQDLLTMGRRGHYTQQALDLNEIILLVAREMEARTTTVTCQMELDKDLMKIKGGGSQICRLLTNLLVNAKDAMDDVGQITIKSENYYAVDTSIAFGRVPQGEYVKLTISDNGCGIPTDIVQKILDPFFTTKTTDNKRGSGLGLSVVDAVMKDHNGYLDLSSEVGQGTSFFLYFPVTRESVVVNSVDCSDGIVGGSEKVLVVDDDQMQRDVFSLLLGKLGYEVETVDSGKKAVEFLRENPQDLVILDMFMPGGVDGIETYMQILKHCPNQKAIIVSGFSETDRTLEAQQLGIGGFVSKPITMKTIAAAVRTELDRKITAPVS